MALPTQIASGELNTERYFSVPVLSSGGNVYVILVDSDTNGLTAYKATDPTSSFSSVGTGPTLSSVRTLHYVQNGDDIHVVTTEDSINDIEYHRFDMSTDTWDVTNEIVDDLPEDSTPMLGPPADVFATIAYRSSVSGDELIIAANGRIDTVMGTDYQRVDFYHKDVTASTWLGTVAIDDGGAVDYDSPFIGLGTSDKVHCVYAKRTGTAIYQGKTISTTNTTSTVSDGPSVASSNFPRGCFSYDDSGTQKIRSSEGEASNFHVLLAEEDGSGNLSWETTDVVDVSDAAPTSNTGYISHETGTTLHALFIRNSDGYIMYDTSTDGGSTWGTDAAEVSLASNHVYTNIYTRSGTPYLAFVYNDTNTYYNEKSLSSGTTTPKSVSHSGVGTASLTTLPGLNKTIISTASVGLTKDVFKSISYTGTGVSSVTKQTGKTLTHTATGTSSLSQTLVFMVSAAMTATGTAALSTVNTFLKSFSVVSTEIIGLTKQTAKTLTHAASATPAIVKQTSKTLSHTVIGTATATQTLVSEVSAAIVAIGTASMSKIGSFAVTLTHTATGTASMTISAILKAFSIVGSGTVALTKKVFKSASMTASGAVSTVKGYFKTLTHSATGTASSSQVKNAGGGGEEEKVPNRGGLFKRLFGRR